MENLSFQKFGDSLLGERMENKPTKIVIKNKFIYSTDYKPPKKHPVDICEGVLNPKTGKIDIVKVKKYGK